jgi:hypothetical protein
MGSTASAPRKRRLADAWRFLAVSGVGVLLPPIAVVLHNAVSAVLSVEEPVFFVLAVFGAPLLIVVGVIGAAEALTDQAT